MTDAKTHVVIRFEITNRFTDADMSNLLDDLKQFFDTGVYADKVCGVLEMGYERQKFNPLKLGGWK